MKLNSILSALVLSSTMFVGHAMAADGTVHFRGEVIDSTCEVTADTKDQYVDLGKVNRTSFTGVESTSAAKAFNIDLEKCPATYTKASLRFDGTLAAGSKGDLAIGNPVTTSTPGDYTGAETNPVTATGVAIRIYNTDNTQLELYKDSTPTDIDTVAGTASMKFLARYVATSATVTPGTANADSQFTIVYAK